MDKTPYYLGLDMGTASVGWAVTDTDYNLLRAKGKDMWGIREFEEASTAIDRRVNRASKRRRQRQQVRMGLLRSYFADAINEVDSDFYTRLDNSKYHLEDKDKEVRYKSAIFHDDSYSDAEYFADYPTIFHLRKKLLETTEAMDVRLIYLAIANLFKHRGHFLTAGLGTSDSEESFAEIYKNINFLSQDLNGLSLPENADIKKMQAILTSREFSRKARCEGIAALWGIAKKEKAKMAIINAICGLKVKVIDLFNDLGDNPDDEIKKLNFSFHEASYEEDIPKLESAIGSERMELLIELKKLHDKALLMAITGTYKYLSMARVANYDKHKKDLKKLKEICKKYLSAKDYKKIFKSNEEGSYAAYVNSNNTNNKKIRRNYKKRGRDEFYKTITGYLKKFKDDPAVKEILDDIDKENFLPKQLTSDNGIIPNQLHAMELKKILSNAEKHHAFLTKKDESGLTVSERIIQLFSFRIPYYIGPVSIDSNGWVVRKKGQERGAVLPWNINDKIDVKETAENFIKKMVRECTYLADEKVLPKSSLLYERYKVLNEINNICIDGERIDVEIKQDIYNGLLSKGKRITRNKLFEYLRPRYSFVTQKEQITGIDINLNNTLAVHRTMSDIFGDKLKEDDTKALAEKIIFWCTIYGDEKKFLKEQLAENCVGEEFGKDVIKRITGMKFRDWGNLSKEFLLMKGCNKLTGETISLIDALWETQYNLMELIHSDNFTFKEELAKKHTESLKVLSSYTIEDLQEEYFSAPVKRMVWQTLLIIKEIEKIKGYAPERIFLEMTRDDDEKKGDAGRKDSRKKQLQALYKSIKADKAWKESMNARIEKCDKDGSLRSKKIYLYFTQRGRDMYTGEAIDFEELLSANSMYDIDHIYPRHFVKDDSIHNNLVLVAKQKNSKKSDVYPIDDSIYQNMKDWWRTLRADHLITETKYNRLIRRTPFTDEDKAGFIARQLVETSQGTKGVADLLKQLLPDTKLIYSKASNVGEFRHKFGLPKSRLLNDFHHANDAYLNIIVGNVYYTKFTQNPRNFIDREYNTGDKRFEYNLNKMYAYDVVRNGRIAWTAPAWENKETGTIVTVKKTMQRNTPLLTRMPIEAHGKLADATLYSHEKVKSSANKAAYITIKASDEKMQDVTKYGGMSSVSTAYFFLVEHTYKSKRVRTLETLPLYLKNILEKSVELLEKYCQENLGYVDPSVRLKKIKIQSLLKLDGYYLHISGKSGNRFSVRNAVQMSLPQYWHLYVHDIEKSVTNGHIGHSISDERNQQLYELLLQKHTEGIFARKTSDKIKTLLIDGRKIFANLELTKQVNVLFQLFNLSRVGITSADLSDINGAKNAGVVMVNSKITDRKECILVNQSVTGLYENRVDLLKI